MHLILLFRPIPFSKQIIKLKTIPDAKQRNFITWAPNEDNVMAKLGDGGQNKNRTLLKNVRQTKMDFHYVLAKIGDN